MNWPWKIVRRRVAEMALIVVIGAVFGLASNFVAKEPLPLWTGIAATPEAKGVPFLDAMSKSSTPLQVIDADTVDQLRNDPGTLLFDARIAAAYAQGHIPGALSLPVVEFFMQFPRLRSRIETAGLVVVYCVDPGCPDAHSLGNLLLAQGIRKIMVFDGGIEEWKRRGYALEVE